MTKQELIDEVTILIAGWKMGEEPAIPKPNDYSDKDFHNNAHIRICKDLNDIHGALSGQQEEIEDLRERLESIETSLAGNLAPLQNGILDRLEAIEAKLEGKKEEESTTNVTCGNILPYSKHKCVLLKYHSCNHKSVDDIEWAGGEIVNPNPQPPSRPDWIRDDGSVIWEKVPVDTKILTKDIEGTWAKGYFAYYEEGAVYWFKNGATSWSEEKCTWTCDRNAKLA